MLIGVMHVPWRMLAAGFLAQPFVAVLTVLVSDYTKVMSLKASAQAAKIDSASLALLLNVDFIKQMRAIKEGIQARLREQYSMFDLQSEMLLMTSIIQSNILLWATFTEIAVTILGLQACLNGDMSWGMFLAFKTYLKMVGVRIWLYP
jgi:ABC-type bacteriocin/lantibiotic exporter with double-glycine peptidase domain